MLQRLPFLPVADAYVSENGGRIFWHVSDLFKQVVSVDKTAAAQVLDLVRCARPEKHATMGAGPHPANSSANCRGPGE